MVTLILVSIISLAIGAGLGLFMASIGKKNKEHEYYQEGFIDGYNKAKEDIWIAGYNKVKEEV